MQNAVAPANLAVVHNIFTVERMYAVRPERVFAAFADPAKKSRWYVNRAQTDVEEFAMDFQTGGTDRARFRFREGTLFPGVVLNILATYQDIVENRRIVTAYAMAFGDKPFSASLATFEFRPEDAGTRLVLTEQSAFFEGADGPQVREQGWQTLLGGLATAIEHDAV